MTFMLSSVKAADSDYRAQCTYQDSAWVVLTARGCPQHYSSFLWRSRTLNMNRSDLPEAQDSEGRETVCIDVSNSLTMLYLTAGSS